MNRIKGILAQLIVLVMCLGISPVPVTAEGELPIPESAPDFSAYTALEGVAFTSEVAEMNDGEQYIDYWDGKPYAFTVGVDIVATFEEACALSKQAVPNVFALRGNQGDIEITAPVNLYGYYYKISPNAGNADETVCPPRSSARDANLETVFDNIYIKEGTLGAVYIGGFTLAGTFYDDHRAVSSEATEITLENVVVSQASEASPNGSHIFVVSNPNNQNAAESGAENKDAFTLRNCRLEKVLSQRISSNQIPPKYTVDGMISVAGCTTFYGFPQWRRYFTNAEFTMSNCYFENFKALSGHNYFIHMEGLNKFNGACTINFTDNVFTGDALDAYIGIYTKAGYDINITGNTFLSKSTDLHLQPLRWLTGYDANIYPDAAANADISNTDLSSIMNISKNRFIGYGDFSQTINSYTAFDLSDNFFTNELKDFKTVFGSAPIHSAGWKHSGYWLDYDFSVYSCTIPDVFHGHAAVKQVADGFVLYSDSSSVNLFDWGFSLPMGITADLSTGESLSEITLNAGVNTRVLTVYSYDRTVTKAYTLTIYYEELQAEAIKRLQNAYIRLNAGCYTEDSLAGYAELIEALKLAIEQNGDVTAALAALDIAEAALSYKEASPAVDIRYYELFSDLNNYTVTETGGWKTFAALVNEEIDDFYGKTVTLTADLDFGGETIDPVGGCFETDVPLDTQVFYGTFDGGCHLIENFVINRPEDYGVGLFGRTVGATVRNVRIGKATVIGYDKIGGLAGFGDASDFINCSSEAEVIAIDGGNGIAGLVSQARRSRNPHTGKTVGATLTDCINYGNVTCPDGRACGIIAWGQGTALVTRCVTYGTLSGDINSAPIGRWNDGPENWPARIKDCYYVSGKVLQSGATILDDLDANAVAWKLGLPIKDGRIVIRNCGQPVYRITLNCGDLGLYDFYGPAGTQADFNITGYYIQEVRDGDRELSLSELVYSADCELNATVCLYNYSITYVMNGGSFVTDPVYTFTVNDAVSLPGRKDAVRDGYLFAGWYFNADFSDERRSAIAEGTCTDMTVYAKFVAVDYEVSDAKQLASIADTVNGGNSLAGRGIKLTADIDMSGVSFSGIGNTMDTPFAGVLEGNGHRITGLDISDVPMAGLIGALSKDGIVSNLMAEGSVSGNVAGGIVGNNMGGLVENCSFDGAVSSSPTEIKIITQNVRVDSTADLHGAADRHTPLKDILLAQDPDVIGFQECTTSWKTYLTADFADYDYVWQYRGQGSNTTTKGQEATPVFYKRDKFNLLDSGTFWLCNTPDKPALCFNESMNRICTWVKLEIKTTREIFFFFNTHFPLDDDSRVKSAAVMREKVSAIAGDYHSYFMTADWNFSYPSNGYSALIAWNEDFSKICEVDATNGSGTYNGFKVTPSGLIDLCFGRKSTVTVPYYKVILDTYIDAEGLECPPSDHYGAYYETELQSAAGGIVGNNEGIVSGSVARNSGNSETFLGAICGKNLGYVESFSYGETAACGMSVGIDETFAAEDLAEGLCRLNQKIGITVWGIENGKPVLLPRGERVYEIRYLDIEGDVFCTQFGTCGKAIPAPEEAGYVFMGWDSNIAVDNDVMTIRPIYVMANVFSLTLLTEGDFTSLSVNGEAVESGASYTAVGGTYFKIKAGEGFLYWKDENGRIYSENATLNLPLSHHTTLTAVYATADRCTVTFADIDGTVLETQIVVRTAFNPKEPLRDGMTFADWDQSYRNLKTDVIIRATYTVDRQASVTVEGGSASAEAVWLGDSVTFTPDTTENFAGWSLDGITVFSTKAKLTLPVWGDLHLTALYTAAEQCGVALNVCANGTVQLIRRVEGNYTVLGSGILYGDPLVITPLLECVVGGEIYQQCDYALTRNGSALFTVENAACLRGYVVLLDEMTGETVVQYTPVFSNK